MIMQNLLNKLIIFGKNTSEEILNELGEYHKQVFGVNEY